jgi:hypothetical protein
MRCYNKKYFLIISYPLFNRTLQDANYTEIFLKRLTGSKLTMKLF